MFRRQGRGRIVELSWDEDGDGCVNYAIIRGTEKRPDGTTQTRLVHAEIRDITTAVAATTAKLQALEVDYAITYTPNEAAPEGTPTEDLILREECDAVFTSLTLVTPKRGERPVWERVTVEAKPDQEVDEPLAEWERRPERHLHLVRDYPL